MHLLIPFAAPLAEAGRQALQALALPQMQRLLARLRVVSRDDGDAFSLSTPHERALARAFGWPVVDGLLPFAAWQAAADGQRSETARDGAEAGGEDGVDDDGWGLLTPSHWHVGTDQVSLADPDDLALDPPAAAALFDTVAPLFTSLGYRMHRGAPLRWYAAHPSLATLPCASLDRVVGRNVDRWLGADATARPMRRLQSEWQMALHEHPLNREREARGLLPVNSFWLSGCGRPRAVQGQAPDVEVSLRGPALQGDWAAWGAAFEAVDAGPVAALAAAADNGRRVRLTLCGERGSVALSNAAGGSVWGALRRRLAPPRLAALMDAL